MSSELQKPPCSRLLVDGKVVAQLLGISLRTVATLKKEGSLPFRQIGRAVRYPLGELQDWINVGCPRKPAPNGTEVANG